MPEEEIKIFRPDHEEDKECKEIVEKFVSLAIPVKITPDVDTRPATSSCCGKAIIVPSKHGDYELEKGEKDCEFTIIQKMKIEIPVKFKVKTDIKKAYIDSEIRKED